MFATFASRLSYMITFLGMCFPKVLVMHCIDFCVISNFCVRQLTIFERTVVAASDLKNCKMVYCDIHSHRFSEIFSAQVRQRTRAE